MDTNRTVGRRLVGISAAALAIGAAVAGCGASTNASGGGSGGGKGGSKTINVGLSSILSGSAASAGQGTDAGVEAYLKTLNAKGGVNGYKFTFDEMDNAYDPATSATVARKLISNGANVIVSEGTAPVQATLPAAVPAKVPIIAEIDGAVVTPPAGQYKSVYGVNPVYVREAAGGARFILTHLHQKKAALVYLNAAGETTSKPAFTNYFQSHGGRVVNTEAIQLTTTDFTPFVEKLKASGAKVVYSFIFDGQLPGLQKAAQAIGYKPTWVGWFDDYSPTYLKLAGNLAAGTDVSLFVTPTTDTSDPNVQQYLAAMKKYAPAQTQNPPAEQGWTIGAIIAKGVRGATAGGKRFSESRFDGAVQGAQGSIGLIRAITYDDQTHAGATKAAFYTIQHGGSVKPQTPYQELPQVASGG